MRHILQRSPELGSRGLETDAESTVEIYHPPYHPNNRGWAQISKCRKTAPNRTRRIDAHFPGRVSGKTVRRILVTVRQTLTRDRIATPSIAGKGSKRQKLTPEQAEIAWVRNIV